MDDAAVNVATLATVSADNESEWEYEYSATETETHLITLDLSIPEFVRRRDDLVVHNTRGGFRSWLNPINIDDARPPTRLASGRDGEGDGDADGDNDGELAEDSDRDNDDIAKPPNGTATNADIRQPPQPPDEPDPSEIQILELHATEPVVAYRGMLFKGAWSETIGTEMLFVGTLSDSDKKRRDKEEPLPRLPNAIRLTDDVDLVGASSARITCTPTEMRARKTAATKEAVDNRTKDGRSNKKRLGFVIPVGNAASAQRQQQASFLEQLMAIKHRRGEPDVVTVQALDTKHNAVRDDVEETKRRARRETQLQVHQERRAKRQRGGGGGGDTTNEGADADDSVTRDDTTTIPGIASAPVPVPAIRRVSRRGRQKARSQIARVAGDDELVGAGASSSQDNVDNNEEEGDEGAEDDVSMSEGDNNDSDA